jgi:hypothetical protein
VPAVRRTAGLAGLVVTGVLVAGCGSAPGADAVTRAADQWLAAARADDPAALCRLLTPAAAQGVVSGTETCPQAVGDLDLPTAGPVREVQVWSDRAQVRTPADTLFLTRIAGRWRIDAAGCTPQGDRPYDCELSD